MVDISKIGLLAQQATQAGQEEEKKKPATGLPAIESVPDIETAGAPSRNIATRLLTDVAVDQDALTREKTEDAERDAAFLDQVS